MDLTGRLRSPEAPLLRLRRSGVYLGLASLAAALVIWWLAARYGGLPAFMLPSPGQVAGRWMALVADGSLLRHTAVTLLEILTGLAVGVVRGCHVRLLAGEIQDVRAAALPVHRRQPGGADRRDRPPAGDLVRPRTVLQGADLRPDRLLPGAGQHDRRAALGAGGAARPDALAPGHPLADACATWSCRLPCRCSWAGCASAPPWR